MDRNTTREKLNIDLGENEPKADIVLDTSQIDVASKTSKYKRTSRMYRLDKLEKHESDLTKAKRAISNGTKKFVDKVKSDGFMLNYFKKRLPFLDWLPKYNLKTYLIADIIAGFTVGKLK